MLSIFNRETKALLQARWNSLPEFLRTDNQVVGQHWVQCAYTMGPSYCSFGCSHCYLPKNANKVPVVPLREMKEQLDANRKMIGRGGRIQITGGDVVDAYLRQGRESELIEIIRYAVDIGLTPMLMTHGQGLLDNPELLEDLVNHGGLRKLSCHIDVTQAGRPGFPIKRLHSEAQLHPLRDQLVDLVVRTRKKTGCSISAAQTVTVCRKNLPSIGSIIDWMISSPVNMDVTRTLSFQVEARVGRTLKLSDQVSPDQVWREICKSTGKDLPGNHLLYGHPDCTRSATLIARSSDSKIVSLTTDSDASTRFWSLIIQQFKGLNLSPENKLANGFRRALLVLVKPKLLFSSIGFFTHLFQQQDMSLGLLGSFIFGRARGFNIVMHNFIDADEVAEQKCADTKDRLSACSFRGAIKINGIWQAVPMCRANAVDRERIYADKIKQCGY